MDSKKVKNGLKRFGKGFWEVMCAIGEDISENREKMQDMQTQLEIARNTSYGERVELTAELLDKLKWMNPDQLSVIFGGKKAVMADTDAYSKLRWFSEAQLEAIFGKKKEEEDHE